MTRVSDMIESKFLKKEDAENGLLLTVQAVAQHNVAMDNQPEQMKWCMEFAENPKPLVMNVTNLNMMQAITGSDDSDDWIGRQVVLFNDPTIQYQGKLVGGIRLRALRHQPAPVPVVDDIPDDSIPF